MNTTPTRPRGCELLWNIKNIIARTACAWFEHDAATMGAARAFYTVSSVAPILIIAIGVVGLVIATETVRANLLPQMQNLFGAEGAAAVPSLLSGAHFMGNSRIATIIGLETLLIGASSVFVELHKIRLIVSGEYRS